MFCPKHEESSITMEYKNSSQMLMPPICYLYNKATKKGQLIKQSQFTKK